MRIGLVAPEFPPEIGGVQTFAWHTAHELAILGHDVTVFTRGHPEGESPAPGFRVEPGLRLRQRLDRVIVDRYAMDVWHGMNATQAWLALETAPVFVTVFGNDFLNMYHPVARLDTHMSDRFDRWLGDALTRRLLRRAMPRVRHVFSISHYTEDAFLRLYPGCRGKTSVASVGIAEDDFAPHEAPRSAGPARLITVCRLAERRKNIPAVLEALGRLQGIHDFHYTIVGDGPLRAELETLAAACRLSERVTFAGNVSKKQRIELLRRSDLLVLPATATARSHEGFGLVYLEANACGTPVLAARLAGAVEAVEEGVSGCFVEQPTAEHIADALDRFLRGDLHFSADACERFARQFSWRSVARRYVARYAESLGL